MQPMTCQEALRELIEAAGRFEQKAARHRRIEAERAALREALTRAQLIVSVAATKRSDRAGERQGSALHRGAFLKGLTGGKAKASTRRGTVKRKT
jgi:hypothetical protein